MLSDSKGSKFQELPGIYIMYEKEQKGKVEYMNYNIVQYDNDESIQNQIKNIFSFFQKCLWDNQTSIQSQYVLQLYEYRVKFNHIKISHQPFLGILSSYQESLTYAQKMMVLSSVSQALLALSAQKICHNAVNPSSIVVCRHSSINIQVKLNNFYYSKKIQNNGTIEKDFRHIKSNFYCSPEMRYNDKVGLKSDVWSIGALYYSMLFDDREIKVTEKKVEFEIYEKTPEWMVTALKNLLAFSPQKRYDINRASYFFRSALTCADSASVCFKQVTKNNLIKIII